MWRKSSYVQHYTYVFKVTHYLPALTYKHVWRQWKSLYHLLLFERILQQSESESKALEVCNKCHQLQRFILWLYSSLHITENRTAFWLTDCTWIVTLISQAVQVRTHTHRYARTLTILISVNIFDLYNPLERSVTSEHCDTTEPVNKTSCLNTDATPIVSVSFHHTSLKNKRCHQLLVAWQYCKACSFLMRLIIISFYLLKSVTPCITTAWWWLREGSRCGVWSTLSFPGVSKNKYIRELVN